MLGQLAFSASAAAGNRIFVYEVAGLQQNEVTKQCDYQIRTSASTFMQVPLNRMNQAMQRIVNSGGKIISIRPLGQEVELPTISAEENKKK